MAREVSLEGALYFTKLSVYLACTWPPSSTASKRETTKYGILWTTFLLSALCLYFPLVYAIVKHRSDLFIVTQSACYLGAGSNLILKMIIYRIHYKRTQTLIQEMENFLANARPHEKIILQRYVNRCSGFHAVISIVNYVAAAMVAISPLVNPDQPLPTGAVYPFSLEPRIVMYVIYVHQCIGAFQCSSGVSIDCQAAVMMWFAGARLEILAEEIKRVSNVRGFQTFVRKHRKLLAYAVEVSDTMSYIAFASSTACGIAAIMSSVQLVGNQPLYVKMQFGPVALIATINLFICAWPADNLINVCELLGNAAYNTPWNDMSVNMMKNFSMVVLRCRKPVIVSVAGFLPTLSLRSYASFLSGLFSYFTTLRLVVSPDSET